MRALVVSPTFPPMRSGGAEHAWRLSRRLAAAGLRIDVVTSARRDVVPDPALAVHPVMRRWSWAGLPRLLLFTVLRGPDVVHLHFSGSIYDDEPMVTFLPTLLKRLLPRVRVVTQIEYPEPCSPRAVSGTSRLLRKLASRLAGGQVDYGFGTILRDSDRLVVLSNVHRAILDARLPGVARKCVLIPPPPLLALSSDADGATRRATRQALGITDDDFVIAFYGYLYPGKGVETLLEAFAHLVPALPRARLLLIGGSNEILVRKLGRPDYSDELRELATHLGIAGRTTWSGYYVSDSDLPSRWLRSADLAILPFDDGVMLNRSSLAAVAAHGLPIVTTRGRAIEPALRDGDNVMLCAPRDPAALAAAAHRVAASPGLRRHLAEGARQLADEWFSWDRAVRLTLEAFGVVLPTEDGVTIAAGRPRAAVS